MTAVVTARPAGTDSGRPSGAYSVTAGAGTAAPGCSTARRRRCSRWVQSGCGATGASRDGRRHNGVRWPAWSNRSMRPWPGCITVSDVRYRRAGAHAAASCCSTARTSGRSWWGWAPWEWARLCGTSAREFVTAQPPPTESTVRPFVVALAYLLGGFTDFHRLGHVQSTSPGLLDLW